MRAQIIGMNCATCESAPYLKETFGCDTPTQNAATWLDEGEEWFSCPVRFITASTMDFLREYDAYKDKFATAPVYGQMSAKFIEAKQVLDHYISKYTDQKQGK